jgi:SAM-dependent methyltransferase
MTHHNWQTFFDHHAPRYMDEVFVKATLAEVDFLIEHLHLVPGMRVLDVGCGTGRHAVELAKRGYKMTGVDISNGMLAEAREAALGARVNIEWVRSPAQDFVASSPFDAAYSVCEGALSLLSLEDTFDRDVQIFARIFAALKPGAPALFTVLNGMRIIRTYSDTDIRAGNFDPFNMVENGRMEIYTPAGKQSIPTRERAYIPTELRLMLRQVGFQVDVISGGTAGNWRLDPPFLDEMEILVIARKPGGS